MTDINKALELLNEFGGIVNSIYGVYLDSTRGFYLVNKQHIKMQQQSLKMLKISKPDLANIKYLETRPMNYVKGDPNKPESVIVQASTQAEFKVRNEKGGTNYKFIANMCLVSIYQYWEDKYRKKIEQALGLEENAVKSDIMGDINWLRQSIIHKKAIASKKVEESKLLKWFKKGAEITIDKDMFEEMVSQIYKFIIEFSQKYCVVA